MKLLSYHFVNAKYRLAEHIKTANFQTAERLLNYVSDNFTTAELTNLFTLAFSSKSKKVRITTASVALDTRNKELIPLLKEELSKQSDIKVKEEIQFAIDNIWQPKGQLKFSA